MAEPAFTTKFFLIVNPGLEELALSELKRSLPECEKIKKELGGIEFETEIFRGLELNSKLKIPSRILLRVDDFKASDFPKLFKKMLKISWKDLLHSDTPLRFEVSSETSRLAIKKRIEDTSEEAIQKYFRTVKKEKAVKHLGPKKIPDEQRIFLRFVDDICTVSIDTSGEHLHKRGYRKLIGEAPLRENLASALLTALFEKMPRGDQTQLELVDPMMGSGTFLLEAYHYFSGSELRNYRYQDWPYVLKNLLPSEVVASEPNASQQPILNTKSLNGFDQDGVSVQIASENFKVLQGGHSSKEFPQVETLAKNLFAKDFKCERSKFTRVLICNPPYGKRLKIEGKISDYYSKLFLSVNKS